MIVKSDGNGNLIVPRWAAAGLITVIAGTGVLSVAGLVVPKARADAYTASMARQDQESIRRELTHIADAALLLTNKVEAHVLLPGHPTMAQAMESMRTDMAFIRSMLIEMRDRLRKE